MLTYNSKNFDCRNKRHLVLNSIISPLDTRDVSRQSNLKVVNYVKPKKSKKILFMYSLKFFDMQSKELSEKLSNSITSPAVSRFQIRKNVQTHLVFYHVTHLQYLENFECM